MKFSAQIRNKEIYYDRIGDLEDFLGKKDGAFVDVHIVDKTRTGQQNRFLWGVVYDSIVEAVERETGQDRNDIHDFYKTKFLRRRLKNGEVVVGSTARLKTGEFKDYVEKVRADAAVRFHVVIQE